ncbi:unknown protein [Azorhizobium caulinodans ORS 571]|uniref:Uncharacterized protein n=1 Tax=Azorhizobium caulinodans (strain ATCC 43989 / DSM 5975 / JCM 20966 / LMG 6465 / NBRC 14845 / NCIMB 13405 / ORS 571) TaxID=438753 RepID=A8IFS2_AZOC5|nr:hypothetical protein [Azorhizobium caulinodans]BAF89643.1 unknown protein [Azorhizobium caulinodans ORS 571]
MRKLSRPPIEPEGPSPPRRAFFVAKQQQFRASLWAQHGGMNDRPAPFPQAGLICATLIAACAAVIYAMLSL